LLGIPLDRLLKIESMHSSHAEAGTNVQAGISVTSYAFIDAEKIEVQAIIILLVEQSHDMCQHRRVLATASCNADFFTSLKQVGSEDGVVNLGFKSSKEASLPTT
jgi:hypothetical protein